MTVTTNEIRSMPPLTYENWIGDCDPESKAAVSDGRLVLCIEYIDARLLERLRGLRRDTLSPGGPDRALAAPIEDELACTSSEERWDAAITFHAESKSVHVSREILALLCAALPDCDLSVGHWAGVRVLVARRKGALCGMIAGMVLDEDALMEAGL